MALKEIIPLVFLDIAIVVVAARLMGRLFRRLRQPAVVGEIVAGIVLAANDPRGVLAVLNLSRTSYRKMLQNLGWAAGYNLLAVPVAAGALAWAGVTLAPAVGAVLMSLSTIVVALNAQLLRGLDLQQRR